MTSETDAEFVADMEWLHSHDREAALPPEKLARLFALARRGAAVQWRPIEEAPKDELILVGPTKRMGICAAMNHSRDGWVTETCADWVPIYTPTHFMPLPPPSAGEA